MAQANGEELLEENNNDPDLLPLELFVMKHPLQYTWTLWYFELDRSKLWEECNHQIASFDTIEDFWSLYHHLKPVPELRVGSDYSLFKQGIRPMWEDTANRNGGRWLINLDKKQRSTELNDYWLDVLLCMIGEGFNEWSSEVCGAVVNIRTKQDKLALWTRDANNSLCVMEIGRTLKIRLMLPQQMMIGYQIHNESKERTCSLAKSNFMV